MGRFGPNEELDPVRAGAPGPRVPGHRRPAGPPAGPVRRSSPSPVVAGPGPRGSLAPPPARSRPAVKTRPTATRARASPRCIEGWPGRAGLSRPPTASPGSLGADQRGPRGLRDRDGRGRGRTRTAPGRRARWRRRSAGPRSAGTRPSRPGTQGGGRLAVRPALQLHRTNGTRSFPAAGSSPRRAGGGPRGRRRVGPGPGCAGRVGLFGGRGGRAACGPGRARPGRPTRCSHAPTAARRAEAGRPAGPGRANTAWPASSAAARSGSSIRRQTPQTMAPCRQTSSSNAAWSARPDEPVEQLGVRHVAGAAVDPPHEDAASGFGLDTAASGTGRCPSK